MTTRTKPNPRFRFRLLLGQSIAVGPGKADLLAAIAETGSISAAGRSMGMSYKKAWHLVDTMNKCFKTPLIETSKGGTAYGGATLTPLGQEALSRYRAIEAKAFAAVTDELAAFDDMIVDTPPED